MEFPKTIIQLLQSSFLTTKEAARTTILSKSWHAAWLTLPDLVLDDGDFKASQRRDNIHGMGDFPKYAKKTLKRYEQSNLKIESFELCMSSSSYDTSFPIGSYVSSTLANKLIFKALRKLGSTRLKLVMSGYSSRNIVLPHELLFGADSNLVKLSMKGCHIKVDKTLETKLCSSSSKLESLSLENVYITRDALANTLSSCHLVEDLSLSRIDFKFEEEEPRWQLPVRPNNNHVVTVKTSNLGRLRCLVLCTRSFKTLFPGDLLSKLPFLVDFTLLMNRDGGYFAQKEEVWQISSCSLERVKIEAKPVPVPVPSGGGWWWLTIKLDVPSIREFDFEGGGDLVPSLCFVSSFAGGGGEWEESRVSIASDAGFTALWFRELDVLLTQLRQSKIHLSLRLDCCGWFDYNVVGGVELSVNQRKHELESLTIDTPGLPSLACYALFDGLFRLCRPKKITHTPKKKKENPNPNPQCTKKKRENPNPNPNPQCPKKKKENPNPNPNPRCPGTLQYQQCPGPLQFQPRPPYQYPPQDPDQRNMNFVLLCQLLDQGIHLKVSDPRQFMYGLNDLEEANAQIFYDDAERWGPPISLKTLILLLQDEEEEELHQQRVRLLLKWKP